MLRLFQYESHLKAWMYSILHYLANAVVTPHVFKQNPKFMLLAGNISFHVSLDQPFLDVEPSMNAVTSGGM